MRKIQELQYIRNVKSTAVISGAVSNVSSMFSDVGGNERWDWMFGTMSAQPEKLASLGWGLG